MQTKIELIESIEREYTNLQAALGGLSEEQLHRPGVVGDWTVKDVLAHIAVWQSRLITSMFKIEKDFKPETVEAQADVDRLNAQWYREQKDRDFEQIWDDLDSSYHQLLKRLDNWSDDALFDPKRCKWMKGQPFAEYVLGDSAEHYAEHAAQIREWRKTITNDYGKFLIS